MTGKDALLARRVPPSPSFTTPAARRLFLLKMMRDQLQNHAPKRTPTPAKSA
jgi:hypothetical protein